MWRRRRFARRDDRGRVREVRETSAFRPPRIGQFSIGHRDLRALGHAALAAAWLDAPDLNRAGRLAEAAGVDALIHTTWFDRLASAARQGWDPAAAERLALDSALEAARARAGDQLRDALLGWLSLRVERDQTPHHDYARRLAEWTVRRPAFSTLGTGRSSPEVIQEKEARAWWSRSRLLPYWQWH